ncbi:MAG: CRISPR system precrRNA processing endoribonuclease RAMP protein Cas6 [Oscillospiraceae bacterium]|nr:CRISPR system precrRNA processing endoribonuclease RAMP protein Cas6 [Oscillospiraceae bacterium]
MLRQYAFSFTIPDLEAVRSEVAVKLHGCLLHNVTSADAERFHQTGSHPFSLYCVPDADGHTITARISSLCEAGDVMIEAAMRLRTFPIPGVGRFPVTPGEQMQTTLPALLETVQGRRFRMLFLTPSGFKRAGKETGFPDLPMHFHSVLRRMEQFENETISMEDFRAAFGKCRFGSWELREYPYHISGLTIPGMAGYADVTLPEEPAAADLLRKVMLYAAFSGTGGRTGMGMGGFFLQSL